MNKFLYIIAAVLLAILVFRKTDTSREEVPVVQEKEEIRNEYYMEENASIKPEKGNLEDDDNKDVRRIQLKGRDNPEYKYEDLLSEQKSLLDLRKQMNKENDDLKNEIGEIKAKVTKLKIDRGEIDSPIYENDLDKIKDKSKIIIPRFKIIDGDFKNIMDQLTELTKRMDPFEEGVEVSSLSEKTQLKKSFNFEFENVPVGEVVRYLSISTGFKYEMTPKGFEFVIPEQTLKKEEVSDSYDPFDDNHSVAKNRVKDESFILKEIERLEDENEILNNVNEELQKEHDALNKQKSTLLKEADQLTVF